MHREKVCILERVSRVRISYSPQKHQKNLYLHPSNLKDFLFISSRFLQIQKVFVKLLLQKNNGEKNGKA